MEKKEIAAKIEECEQYLATLRAQLLEADKPKGVEFCWCQLDKNGVVVWIDGRFGSEWTIKNGAVNITPPKGAAFTNVCVAASFDTGGTWLMLPRSVAVVDKQL